jgi:Zn-dependent peptidase ImmA (M78 family)/DNA-binding XRE family transcriptional regulator
VPQKGLTPPSSMIAQLRVRRGWTQQQLADKLGIGHAQTISQIEKGERSLKATEVARLADIFSISPLDILSGRVPPEGPFVLWREVTDEEARSEEEARLVQRCRRFAFLEQLEEDLPRTGLPRLPLKLPGTSYEQVRGWAHEMRSSLGLNAEIPAAGLRDILENRNGIKIFVSELRAGSAAAMRADFGDAILLARNEVDARQSFSLAHELFHLLTWDVGASATLSKASKQRNEELANVFASALLLPEDPLRSLLAGHPLTESNWMYLVRLAAAYRVSLPALVWRLVSLGLLEKPNAGRILASRVLKKLNRSQATEEAEDLRELPARFVNLAFSAFVSGKISTGKLAELLETTVGMLPEKLSAYGLDPESDAYQASILST